MDEKALNELLECSVCLDQLDGTSKVLPCQHTFCKRCLEEIVSTKHELRCPECRFHVEMRVDDLPSNILLIRLLEGLKTQSRISQVPGYKRESVGSPGASRADNPNQAVAAFARQQQQRQASSSSRPCAKALFNYEAKDPGDLSFKKGDVVLLRKQVDENWYHGELNAQHGFFPATYVQVLTALPDTIPQCKGIYDFAVDDKKEEDCMSFKKDDVMTVIRKVDENWLEVKKGDKIGILPTSFVELNDPAKVLLRLTDKTSTVSSTGSGPPVTPAHPVRAIKEVSPGPAAPVVNKRHSLTTIPLTVSTPASALQRRSLDSNTDPDILAIGGQTCAAAPPSTATMTTELPIAKAAQPLVPAGQPALVPPRTIGMDAPSVPSQRQPEPQMSLDQLPLRPGSDAISAGISTSNKENVASGGNGSVTPMYVAVYNYKPQKGDELELQKGEYYSVSEKCLDGWYKGMALKNGTSGVFPGNYVQSVIPLSSASKSSSKSSVTKPKLPQPSEQSLPVASRSSRTTISPPRPKTSSSEAIGHSSSSSPSSPILTTSKTTRYVRAAKSTSPNISAKSHATSNPSANSPVWKHSMSASAIITPPNVVVGASANPAQTVVKEKEKKRDKEKLSLMKRITSAGKLKKPRLIDVEAASLSDSSVSHSRSGSFPSDTAPLVAVEPSHKKSGSFDSTSQTSHLKPVRPKPLMREKYRCADTYPAQSEIELDLKVGDVIYVHKKREDGWYKGTLQRSGKTGLFPGSFVEKGS